MKLINNLTTCCSSVEANGEKLGFWTLLTLRDFKPTMPVSLQYGHTQHPHGQEINWIPVLAPETLYTFCIKIHKAECMNRLRTGAKSPHLWGNGLLIDPSFRLFFYFFSLSGSQNPMFLSQKHHRGFWRDASRAGCVLVVIILPLGSDRHFKSSWVNVYSSFLTYNSLPRWPQTRGFSCVPVKE